MSRLSPDQITTVEELSGVSLANLCTYYLDCLSHDDQGGIRLFASSKYGNLDYAELDQLPISDDTGRVPALNEAALALLSRVRKDKNRLTTLIGYPVNVVEVSGKNGWKGMMLEPFFIFSVDATESNRLSDEPPEINSQALKTLTGASGPGLLEELVQLSDELGLGEAVRGVDPFTLAMALAKASTAWPWLEQPSTGLISPGPSLSDVSTPGIYNRAVLVLAERSPFTKGLITELSKLRETDDAATRETALGAWLNGNFSNSADGSSSDALLLEVLPLNVEQRHAVGRALSQPLTVITGPPGTGKSQVVSSILINAAWRGQRVLFASKNNRAVDVVEERVNSLGTRPILLRLGASEYQSKLALHLTSLLSVIATPADRDEYATFLDVHTKLSTESQALDEEQQHIVDNRNTLDELDQALDGLRSTLGQEDFSALRDFDVQRAAESSGSLLLAARRADRERQSPFVRFLWPLIGGRRLARLDKAIGEVAAAAKRLKTKLPDVPLRESDVRPFQATAELLKTRAELAILSKSYFNSLAALTQRRGLEDISRERLDVASSLARNAEKLWAQWLRLQPSQLTRPQRDILQQYATTIQLLAGAGTGDKQVGAALRKQQQLFPKVVDFLGCWAVTSLSAKGRLPLQPGFFDLLIVDEASQCDIASAIPLLFRAKRAVVIGDPNQLRHISALAPAHDNKLLARHGLLESGVSWSYSVNSLYDRASGIGNAEDIVNLRDHHRSHADIIAFSNKWFYGSSLRVATNYDRLKRPDGNGPAVRWVNVRGRVERPPAGGAVNREEARAVVKELERLLLEQQYRGSVGVVSPFRAQTNYIRDLIHANGALLQALMRADYLVDTVHKFQGDERDVILFSPVISSGTPHGAINFLKRTPHLFNVAITRARAALTVVGDESAAGSFGVEYLAEYAQYVAQRDREAIPSAVEREVPTSNRYPSVAHPERVSDWERQFFAALFDGGLRPIPQYQVEMYTLDFALLAGNRRLNIEVDGERFHRRWDGELTRRDQLRNQRLIELGWDIKRFWVYQLRDDTARCVEYVRKWYQQTA